MQSGVYGFDEGEEQESGKDLVLLSSNNGNPSGNKLLAQLFWEMRHFSIGLLQNRNYAVWERMIILGLCFEKIQQLKDSHGDPKAISQAIGEYHVYATDGGFKGAFSDNPVNLAFKFMLVTELFLKRLDASSADPLFGEVFRSLLEFFRTVGATSDQQLTAAYLQARGQH